MRTAAVLLIALASASLAACSEAPSSTPIDMSPPLYDASMPSMPDVAVVDAAQNMMAGESGGGAGGVGGDGAGGDSGGGACCMPSEPAAKAAASGSRLKLRQYIADDGSKLPPGWWDSERNEECAFNTWLGDMRCLPPAVFSTTFYYADSACSLPLASVGCDTSLSYVLVTAAGTCTANRTMHPLDGARWTGAVYTTLTGSCAMTADPCALPEQACDLVRVGDEIPASAFVAATLEDL